MSASIAESLTMRGELTASVIGPDGKVRESQTFHNLIVQVGHNFVATALGANSTSPFNAIAVGTGSNAPASGDTTLQTELARKAATASTVANVTTFSNTFTAGQATGAITEAGIFNNAVAAGTMFSRVTFSVINVGALDSLALSWAVTA